MLDALLRRAVRKLPHSVRLQGRILFLTEEPVALRSQLEGRDLE